MIRRGVVVGCTHAQLMLPSAYDALQDVFDKWKPTVLIHLGDFLDMTALRSGAEGTKDEGARIDLDLEAGYGFLRWYFKRRAIKKILMNGNHDCPRWLKWDDHPNAAKAELARLLHKQAEDAHKEIGNLDVYPYDIKRGWARYAGAWWGHGYMHGEQAVRDTAEMMGGITYTAHIHRIEERRGRTRIGSLCRSIGWLGDDNKAGYARHRRNTLAWENGFLLTEHTEKETHAWQIRMDGKGKFRLPI